MPLLALSCLRIALFFLNDTAPSEIYTLSLHGRSSDLAQHRHGRGRVVDPARHPRNSGIPPQDRKSTRLNSSHVEISYAVFCLKKNNNTKGVNIIPARPVPGVPATKADVAQLVEQLIRN